MGYRRYMRPAAFALCIVSLAACSDSTQIKPVTVQWMDWPWQVAAGQPFRARLVVWGVCAQNPRFRSGATADQSAVTFAPYFIIEKDQGVCVASIFQPIAIIGIDTAGMAPGLQASSAYEMRAASFAPTMGLAQSSIPNRTFGQVSVALPFELIVVGRRNAAGFVTKEIDNAGCVRIRPTGLYQPDAALVLENPVDTAGLSGRFVRGYIYEPAAPMCGDTRVFHLVARE